MGKIWHQELQTLGQYCSQTDSFEFKNGPAPDTVGNHTSGIIPINQLAFIKVVGKDAESFLQGQLTCDLAALTNNKFQYAAHCTVKGKILNFYRICKLTTQDNCYLLMCHKSMSTLAVEKLKKYAMFSDVEITDVSEHYAAICFFGKKVNQDILSLLDITFEPDEQNQSYSYNNSQINGQLLRLQGPYLRMLFVAPVERLLPYWQNALPDIPLMNTTIWELSEIRSSIPIIYPETSNLFFPHDLNLPILEAVSFKKGCYLGQEVITRMQFRGKSNKQLHHAFVESKNISSTLAGTEIFSSEQTRPAVGTVLASSPTNDNVLELLVCIHNQYKNLSELHLSSPKGKKLQELAHG